MKTTPIRLLRNAALALCATSALGCLAGHSPLGSWQQPAELTREWVDVEKSVPDDTTLWVLGPAGYDGIAHLLRTPDSAGVVREVRKETRYGYWHFEGTLGDTARQAICFSPRSGRIGATCTAFVIDTILSGARPTPRLTLKSYHGRNHTRDRRLLSRTPGVIP